MQSCLQIFKISFAIYISFCIHVKFLCVVICLIFVDLPVTAKGHFLSECCVQPLSLNQLDKPKFFVLKQF